jgi:hypothetical protein
MLRARAPPPRPPPAAQPPHVAPRLASRLTAGVVPRAAGLAPPRSPKKNRKGTGKGGHANATGRRPDAIGIGRCGRDAGRSGPDGTTARRGADQPRRDRASSHRWVDARTRRRAMVGLCYCPTGTTGRTGSGARRPGSDFHNSRAGGPLVFIYHQVCARSVRNKNSTQPAATHWCRLDARAPAFVKPSCSSDPPRTATTPAPTPRRHPTC